MYALICTAVDVLRLEQSNWTSSLKQIFSLDLNIWGMYNVNLWLPQWFFQI